MENLDQIKLNTIARINLSLEHSIDKSMVRHTQKMAKLYIEANDIDVEKAKAGKALLASLGY